MLNRRRFLAAAGTVAMAMLAGCARIWPARAGANPGGAATGAAPSRAPAAPAPAPAGSDRPFRVALFSDVHLQPPAAELTGNNLKLKQAVDDFVAAAAPDAWVT